MALSWRKRRQVLYYGVGGVFAFLLLLIAWQTFFSRQPTCFDGIQNQSERGVDCGGSCALLCSFDAREPVALWNRAFQVTPSTYTAAAEIRNDNGGSFARAVRYSFKLYDGNILVAERVGAADLPPVQDIFVIETNIDVGNRVVTRSEFAFADSAIRWQRNTQELPALRITERNLAADGSRLTATLVNDSVVEARDVSVTAVLFGADGTARAASKSVIPRISRGSSQPVIFTWPGGVFGAVRAEITVLPSL